MSVAIPAVLAIDYTLEVPLIGKQQVSGPADYIKTFFIFGLMLVGVTALFAIVLGGFIYLLAGASETRKTQGKEWIWGGVSGLLLLLCSYLILNTINPQLVSLREPELEAIYIPPHVGLGYNLTNQQLQNIPVSADLETIFQQAAQQYGIPVELLKNLARVESQLNPNAVSPAGAQGIMQFMPATAARFGINPWDPSQAIPAAAQYLGMHYNEFGSWENAVAAYNCGEGNMRRYGGNWQNIPFSETRNHVIRVFGLM